MTSFKEIDRIVIAGVGLIGGSVGLALKKNGFKGKIKGLGRRWSSLKKAIDKGSVDSATLDYDEALKDADLLIIGTPVDTISHIARKAVKYTQDGCIITDVGSTKGQLVAEIESFTPENIRFVGCHPMAGSHKTSVEAADPHLFEGSVCIITTTELTGTEAVSIVSDMWRTIGARVELMSPQEHDLLIAAASHLPHIAACALTRVVASVENHRGRAIDFSSTGFADTTRIASGSPDIWKGILLQNADMVSSMLEKLERELTEMRKALDSRDEREITEKLAKAKYIRDSIRR
jgi:prephenate dehydrogenase